MNTTSVISSEIEFRVRYCETDQMGIVHHPNYLIWFENGRIDLLNKCGINYSEMEKNNEYFPVVSCAVKYINPARFDDLLVVKTVFVKSTESRICFGGWIYTPENVASEKAPLAKLYSEHAYAEEDFTALKVPENILTTVQNNIYEKRFFSKRKKPPGI